eukprot:g30783.t1
MWRGREYVSGGGISLKVEKMALDDLLDVAAGGIVEMETDVKEGKGGVRSRPGKSEGRVEVGSEIYELFQFQTRKGSNTDDIIDMLEKELWMRVRIGLEQGMFHVPHEETGITEANVGMHHPFDLKTMPYPLTYVSFLYSSLMGHAVL